MNKSQRLVGEIQHGGVPREADVSRAVVSRAVARRAVWLSVYLFFVLAPVLALLMGDLPPARDFWTEFSAAIAYVGLSMMGLQYGLAARFRYVTEPWGEDVI